MQTLLTYSTRSDASGPGAVLLHPTAPRWLVLNHSALQIATELLRGRGVEATSATLVAEYGVSPATARRDVAAVLEHLEQEDFWQELNPRPMTRTPEPRSLFLHLTSRCNLSCGHCYASSGKGGRDLPADSVIALIDRCLAGGVRRITLSGGEPLCHPQLERILRHAASGMEVQLLTNGMLIDATWARRLAQLGAGITISLDGSRPELHDRLRGRGSFRRTMRAVELLRRAGTGGRISVNTTVTGDNFADLEQIVALAQRLSVRLIRFLPLRRAGRADDQWQRLGALSTADYEGFFARTARWQRQGKFQVEVSCGLSGVVLKGPGPAATGDELWCPVGYNLVVDHRGDAFPCVLLMRPAFRLGNIFHHDPVQLVRSKPMAGVCDALARRRQEIASCRRCLWRNLCQGGCMAKALEDTGTLWQTDRFCAYRQRAYAAAFDGICSLHHDRGERAA